MKVRPARHAEHGGPARLEAVQVGRQPVIRGPGGGLQPFQRQHCIRCKYADRAGIRQSVDGTFAADHPVRRKVFVLGTTHDRGGSPPQGRLANLGEGARYEYRKITNPGSRGGAGWQRSGDLAAARATTTPSVERRRCVRRDRHGRVRGLVVSTAANNTATRKQTITDRYSACRTKEVAGCWFDSQFNLYTADFGNTKVVKHQLAGDHAQSDFCGHGHEAPDGHSDVDRDGGERRRLRGPCGRRPAGKELSCDTAVTAWRPPAPDLTSTIRQVENGGIDWMDLSTDQRTMFYTSRSRKVRKFNVDTNAQRPGRSDFDVAARYQAIRDAVNAGRRSPSGCCRRLPES